MYLLENMVKVITIRDDVYADLFRLKKSRGMSFSLIIEYLIKEKEGKTKNVLTFAGSINNEDVDIQTMDKIKKGLDGWKKSV